MSQRYIPPPNGVMPPPTGIPPQIPPRKDSRTGRTLIVIFLILIVLVCSCTAVGILGFGYIAKQVNDDVANVTAEEFSDGIVKDIPSQEELMDIAKSLSILEKAINKKDSVNYNLIWDSEAVSRYLYPLVMEEMFSNSSSHKTFWEDFDTEEEAQRAWRMI